MESCAQIVTKFVNTKQQHLQLGVRARLSSMLADMSKIPQIWKGTRSNFRYSTVLSDSVKRGKRIRQCTPVSVQNPRLGLVNFPQLLEHHWYIMPKPSQGTMVIFDRKFN